MDRRAHWDEVYSTKGERDVSWFEDVPALSIEMLEAAGVTLASCVLDVGGGESHLVDHLLARGLRCLAVLDVSAAALARARARLGSAAADVQWIVADVAGAWSAAPVDIWHDRAVFHFLTTPQDRVHYRAHLMGTLKRGGSAIMATFGPDGPQTCSGLPVMRYSPESLAQELGSAFALAESRAWVHTTPWGATQSFQYARLIRIA
ncbi:methyltransferase domain-containing protein [Luteitalea sp.]